jgi:NACalpha-BTF3-like transcription factor
MDRVLSATVQDLQRSYSVATYALEVTDPCGMDAVDGQEDSQVGNNMKWADCDEEQHENKVTPKYHLQYSQLQWMIIVSKVIVRTIWKGWVLTDTKREYFHKGKVFSNKDTQEDIALVMRSTQLSKKEVVHAMSNERWRLKSIGWTEKDLRALADIPVIKKQLHQVCELLGMLLNSEAVPGNLSDKFHETKKLLVGAFLMSMSIADPFYRTLSATFLWKFKLHIRFRSCQISLRTLRYNTSNFFQRVDAQVDWHGHMAHFFMYHESIYGYWLVVV